MANLNFVPVDQDALAKTRKRKAAIKRVFLAPLMPVLLAVERRNETTFAEDMANLKAKRAERKNKNAPQP